MVVAGLAAGVGGAADETRPRRTTPGPHQGLHATVPRAGPGPARGIASSRRQLVISAEPPPIGNASGLRCCDYRDGDRQHAVVVLAWSASVSRFSARVRLRLAEPCRRSLRTRSGPRRRGLRCAIDDRVSSRFSTVSSMASAATPGTSKTNSMRSSWRTTSSGMAGRSTRWVLKAAGRREEAVEGAEGLDGAGAGDGRHCTTSREET